MKNQRISKKRVIFLIAVLSHVTKSLTFIPQCWSHKNLTWSQPSYNINTPPTRQNVKLGRLRNYFTRSSQKWSTGLISHYKLLNTGLISDQFDPHPPFLTRENWTHNVLWRTRSLYHRHFKTNVDLKVPYRTATFTDNHVYHPWLYFSSLHYHNVF